jgi:hypothetical protein
MSMVRALSVTCLLAVTFLPVACGPSSNTSDTGCATNADCADGKRCAASGACVACTVNEHCGDGQFCCQGACYEEALIEDRCGCAANPGSTVAPGEPCTAGAVCVAGSSRATVDTVSAGTCGCSCSASQGGTLCTLAPDEPEGFQCTCARTDLRTCETPVIDRTGVPHGVADTCTPQNSCVCFAAGQTCDPEGTTPDCTFDGCANLYGDDSNCGVANRDCTHPDTGTGAGGLCMAGGCSCDEIGDCQGSGLNVDSCTVFQAGGQCVCSGYVVSGRQAACPLGLSCSSAGCLLEGTSYGTALELYEALGIAPGSVD